MSEVVIDRRSCLDLTELEGVVTQALQNFGDFVFRHQTNNWNTIRVELWNDTGRVLIFPSLEGSLDRVDQCSIEITCDGVQDTIYEATNSNMPESEYEYLESGISAKIVGFISSASTIMTPGKVAVYVYGDELLFKT